MLNVIDQQWKDHLLSMDHLKEGIGLRGYGQKDPLIEYKKESYVLFQDMMDRIEDETIRYLYFLQVSTGPTPPGGYSLGGDDGGRPRPILPFSPDGDDEEEQDEEAEAVAAGVGVDDRKAAQSVVLDVTRNIQRKKDKEMAALQFAGGEANSTPNKPVIKGKKPGRNELCSCGSGKKYKKCCGAA
jgi:preprotein translocase subunit SecA